MNEEAVIVCLDRDSLLTLLAGGNVKVPHAGILVIPGTDLQRFQQRIRTRVNGGTRIQGPPPAKELE